MGESFERLGVAASGHGCFEKIFDRHKKDAEVYIDDTDNYIRVDNAGHDRFSAYHFNYDHVHPFGVWLMED